MPAPVAPQVFSSPQGKFSWGGNHRSGIVLGERNIEFSCADESEIEGALRAAFRRTRMYLRRQMQRLVSFPPNQHAFAYPCAFAFSPPPAPTGRGATAEVLSGHLRKWLSYLSVSMRCQPTVPLGNDSQCSRDKRLGDEIARFRIECFSVRNWPCFSSAPA